ncbi:MAG: hypothetical protein JW704_02120 [Anaerolineaceae bacterium]|nr:hypothetical protein [Anaerolineaceae bacterium]
MAIRCHVPILAFKEVMDAASITPEEEEPPATPSGAKPETASKRTGTAHDRLSIFEDFIDQLDADDNQKGGQLDADQPKPRKPKKA